MTVADVQVRLLGGFEVRVDGHQVPVSAWPTRRAVDLVQLLALAPRHTVVRDRVIEALWPRLTASAGAANLRKAAHHARRALGHQDAVVLHGGTVALFPGAAVSTDLDEFVGRAAAALAEDSPRVAARVARSFPGDLLPDSPYEDWNRDHRDRVTSLLVDLLRHAGEWSRLIERDPTDEAAYRELMRAAMESGNRHAAIDWYDRLRAALRAGPGVSPDAETRRLYDACVAGLAPPEPVLLGRQWEVAELTALLRTADPRRCGVVAVRGPAGIGKSALCRVLVGLAESEGWQTAVVLPSYAAVAYGVAGAVIDQLFGADRNLASRLSDRAGRVLRTIAVAASDGRRVNRPLTRQQAIGSLRRLFAATAEGAPVMVVVDDAHRADDASVDALLNSITGDTPPALLVLAYRTEGAPDALAHGVQRLCRAGWAMTLDLAPLAEREARAVVAAESGDCVGPDQVQEVVALASGNPFFLSELAHRASRRPGSLGHRLAEAVSTRFADLDAGTVAMLSRLALAEDELTVADVVAFTGSTEEDAFVMLDHALGAGVLVVADGRYRFWHELVRQGLADRLAPHQQVAVHRDAARRLASSGAPPAAVARHWLDGGLPQNAIPWLLDAARNALDLGAFPDALGLTESLLAHTPDQCEALALRALALDGLGDRRAPAAYATAARSVNGSEADDLRAQQALAQLKLGDPTGALHTLEGIAPAALPGRVARALTLSGAAAMGFGDLGTATAAATEARRLAVDSGDATAVVQASWAMGLAAHARGELAASVRADLEDTHAVPVLAGHVFDGMLCAAERLLYGARPYVDVIDYANSLADEARRLGASRGYAFALTLRGEAHLFAGRLDQAEADLAEGQRLHEGIGAALGTALALERRAEVAHHRHQDRRALTLADEALAVARESDVGFHLLDRVHGARISATTEPDAVLVAVEDAEAGIRGPLESCPGCRITLAVPAAIGSVRAGDRERAERYAGESELLAAAVVPLPAWFAAVEEVRGLLARLNGDSSAAIRHLESAVAGFAAVGHVIDEQRCRAQLRAS